MQVRKSEFKAILFDLDGTLLDTLADLADAGNTALAEFGYPNHPKDAYRYFIGEGMEKLVRQILPAEHRDDKTVRRCMQFASDTYRRIWRNNSRPYKGIAELLTELENRGLAKAILSNKPDEFTRIMVKEVLSQWQFAIVRGARLGVPIKPDPTAALAIATELNISPAEILYLGDSNIDMRTADAAGMYAVGVLWGFREADELLSNGAKKLVKTPQEILQLL